MDERLPVLPLSRPDRLTVAEQSVLGGLLLDNGAIERVNGLAVEHFQSAQHRLIYSAICDEIEDGAHGAADVVTVYERLKRNGTADNSLEARMRNEITRRWGWETACGNGI